MIESIILSDLNGSDRNELQLHKGKTLYTAENVLETKKSVKADIGYKCFIKTDEILTDIAVYLNNEKQNIIVRDAEIDSMHGYEIVFGDYGTEQKIFKYCLGFIQFVIKVYDDNDESRLFHSDLASVLIPVSFNNDGIVKMLNYIYRNQNDLLCRQVTITDKGSDVSEAHDDFASQLVILEEVVGVYESNYGYFKANCKYKLEQVETVDRVDHLQYIDAKTVQYMAQHPEYLQRSRSGINYGRQFFLPTKTMMLQNHMTKDIYENQVVLDFLKRVVTECGNLRRKIKEYIKNVDTGKKREDEYIVSSYLIYQSASKLLNQYDEKIRELKERLEVLYISYKQALGIEEMSGECVLRPTQIFLSVPQYNRVYLCMLKWNSKALYNFGKERTMLNFMNAPQIYECYVLAKLVNQFKAWGYQLEESSITAYDNGQRSVDYNNTFIFNDGTTTITLYYEPIIYCEAVKNTYGISLYRNNSVTLGDGDSINEGFHYCPDYVIKAEANGKERYVICDAKFSGYENVKNKLTPKLAFKYLYSISPLHENARVCGMNIFYGLFGRSQHISQNFHNYQIGRPISPYTYIIPMGEGMEWEEQENNLNMMLSSLVE